MDSKSLVKDEQSGLSTLLDASLDFRVHASSHGTYRFNKLGAMDGYPSTLATNLITGGPTQAMRWAIPSTVGNMMHDVIQWDQGAIPAEAGKYLHEYRDKHGEINALRLLNELGSTVVEIKSGMLQPLVEVLQKKELPESEIDNDTSESLYNPYEQVAVNLRSDASPAKLPYEEYKQVHHSPNVNDAIAARTKRLRLGRLKGTFFAMNKNIIFPEKMILEVEFSPAKIGYTTTSPPFAAVVGPLNFAAGVGISISNAKYYHCVETDPDIIKHAEAELAKGMMLPIPVVTVVRKQQTTAAAGSEWTLDLPLDANTYGPVIQQIITTIMPSTDSSGSDTCYEHDNTAGRRIARYKTLIDGNPIQQSDIDCTKYDDWLLHRKMLEESKSILKNKEQYQRDWFHCEDFSGNENSSDRMVMAGKKNNGFLYSFNCTSQGAIGAVGGATLPSPVAVYQIVKGIKFLELKKGVPVPALSVK